MNYDIIFLILSIMIVLIFINDNIKETFSDESIDFHKNFVDFNNKYLDLSKTYQKIIKDDKKAEVNDIFLDGFKKLYYNVPIEKNSELSNNILDKSVLKNFRIKNNFNTYSQELTYLEVAKILDNFSKTKKYKLNDFSNPEIIGLHFTKMFNRLFFLLNMNQEHHKSDSRMFKMTDFRLLIRKQVIDFDYKIVYEVKIYKETKHYGFVFQITIKHNEETNIISYLNLELVGMVSEEDIFFEKQKGGTKCKFDLDIDKDECFKLNYNNKSNLNKYDFIDGTYIDKELDLYFKRSKNEKDINENYRKFRCFGKQGFNKSECMSYDPNTKVNGVWDRPCNNDTECPFYKKNTNYENKRGGCKDGFCELPINMKQYSYRFYKKDVKPFCHNCDIPNCKGETCFTCCEDQKDKTKYPNLKSPDYMFSNDYTER